MIVSINGPAWFFKLDSVFQIIFALVTIAIMLFSYRAFHFTKLKKFKYFSASFLLIALGFLTLSLSNLLIYLNIYDGIISRMGEFNLGNSFFLAYIMFTLFGYMLLIIVSMQLEHKRLVALLFAIVMLFVIFSYQYYIKFHMISLLLLGFIGWQFYENYAKKKSVNAGLVFASFYTLAFAEVFFISTVLMSSLYVLAHILQLIGFGLLFTMFIRVNKHGGKKK